MHATGLGAARAVRGDFSAGSLAQAVPQMPSVSNLDRVGQCPADRFGVGAGTVPADDLDTGVLSQPCLQGCRHCGRAARPPAVVSAYRSARLRSGCDAATQSYPRPAPAEPAELHTASVAASGPWNAATAEPPASTAAGPCHAQPVPEPPPRSGPEGAPSAADTMQHSGGLLTERPAASECRADQPPHPDHGLRPPRVEGHVAHGPLVNSVHPGRQHATIRARHRHRRRPCTHHDPVAGVLNLFDHQRCQPSEHHTSKIINDTPRLLSNLDSTRSVTTERAPEPLARQSPSRFSAGIESSHAAMTAVAVRPTAARASTLFRI